jgi:hypothetical protein
MGNDGYGTMNDELYERAKREAKRLRDRVKPRVDEALAATEKQTENAVTHVSRLLRRAAQAVRNDIDKRL